MDLSRELQGLDSEPNSPVAPPVVPPVVPQVVPQAKLTTVVTAQPTNLTTITPVSREHVSVIPLNTTLNTPGLTTTAGHSIVRVSGVSGVNNVQLMSNANSNVTPTIRTISSTTPLQKVTLNNGAQTPITVVASGSSAPGAPKTYHVVMPVTNENTGHAVKKLKTEFESPQAVKL